MKRIKLILAAATAMAVLMVMTAAPAVAQACVGSICTGGVVQEFEQSGSSGNQQGVTQSGGSGVGDISLGGGSGGSSSGGSGNVGSQQGVTQSGGSGGDIDLD